MKYPILFVTEDEIASGAWYAMAVPVQGTKWYQLYTTFKKKNSEFCKWKIQSIGFRDAEKADLVRLEDLKEYKRIDRLTALLLFEMRTD